MMHNVLAFDVRAFDALAPLLPDESTATLVSHALAPGDPGYKPAVDAGFAAAPVGLGAFVDLGYATRPTNSLPHFTNLIESQFSSMPLLGNFPTTMTPGPPWRLNYGGTAPFNGRPRTYTQFTYDTLTLRYERDADLPRIGGMTAAPTIRMADEDDDGVVDEMTNGWDDDGNLAVDDDGEREAPSPYGDPLRGVKVTIRFAESDTRQVRQTSVVKNFVPD